MSLRTFACGLIAALTLAGAPAWSQDKKQPAPAPAPDPKNLDKQIEDAIKLLDKLDPKDTDEAKRQLQDIRKQLPGFGIGGIAGVGGVPNVNLGNDIGNIFGALNGPLGGGNAAMPNLGANVPNGRFGAMLKPVDATLQSHLRLEAKQGQVLSAVMPNSAAAKAGLKQHDILLEIAGKAVSTDPAAFNQQLAEVKSDVAVDVTVLREGKKETVKGLKLAVNPLVPGFAPGGAPGVPNIQIFPGGGGVQIVPGPGGVPNIQIPPIQIPGGGNIQIPPIQIPNAPGAVPGGPGGGAGGIQIPQGAATIRVQTINLGANESTAVTRNGDDFTINHTAGNLKIDITGKNDNGKAVPSEISIDDGDTHVRAQTLAQVPPAYQAAVNRLLESVK